MNVACLICKREIDTTNGGFLNSKLTCKCGEIVGDYKRFRSGNIQVSLKLVRSDDNKKVYAYGVSMRNRYIVCLGQEFKVPSYMDEKQAASELLSFIASSNEDQIHMPYTTPDEVLKYAEVNFDNDAFPYRFQNEVLYEDCFMTIQ